MPWPNVERTERYSYTCGYCGKDLSPWAESPDSETFRIFGALAEEIDALIGWGFAERTGSRRVYNSFALLGPDQPVSVVHKTHLHMSGPGSRANEPDLLVAGDRLGLVNTRVGRMGIMICYDGCFVEVPRSLVLQGADCILWPTASGTYLGDTGFPRIRAIDNVVPIVMIEGSQAGTYYPKHSHSQIVGHKGDILAECTDDEGLLYVTLDLDEVRHFRQTALGAWAQYRVRRPDLYASLTAPQT